MKSQRWDNEIVCELHDENLFFDFWPENVGARKTIISISDLKEIG